MDYTPSTELAAVNQMLTTVDESPVNDLVSPDKAVSIAQQILKEVATAFQSRPWSFNVDLDVTLEPDANSEIVLANNVVSVEPYRMSLSKPVLRLRDRKLYDSYNNTSSFTGSVRATVVYLMDWVDIPQPARVYLIARAARMFNERVLNDDTKKQWLRADEADAFSDFKIFEAEQEDYSAFSTIETFNTLNRRSPINPL
jgi:hypothetical protein